MDNKIEIVALFGKSGSGKNYLENWIINKYPNLSNRIIRQTTRPKRANEWDRVDYNFVSVEEFTKDLLSGEMVEAENFNNWFYGTNFSAFDKTKVNVGCYSITAIETLKEDKRFDVLPIYIKSLDRIRLIRSINRDSFADCSEICRRFLADEKDFKDENFPFDFCTYYNDEKIETDLKKVDGFIDMFYKIGGNNDC